MYIHNGCKFCKTFANLLQPAKHTLHCACTLWLNIKMNKKLMQSDHSKAMNIISQDF